MAEVSSPVSASLSRRGRSASSRNDREDDIERESLAYKVLSAEKTKQFSELEDAEEVQRRMAEAMDLKEDSVDLQTASILDYYTSGFLWAKEQRFSLDQQSAFFTLIHVLLENLKDKQMSLVDNLKEFKKMLMGIGVDSAEESGGLECFEPAQATSIADFLHSSLFQHYQMYEFLFTHNRAEEIIGTDLNLEIAPSAEMPWPPPLDEGVSEEIHQTYIATPPSSPEPQVEEGSGEPAAGDEASTAEGEDADEVSQKEADLLAQLSTEEVTSIMNSVFQDVLGGLQSDVAQKLREKENAFINRINKIHKVAQS